MPIITNNSGSKYKVSLGMVVKKTSKLEEIANNTLHQGELIYDIDLNVLRVGKKNVPLKDLPIFCAPQNDNPSDGKMLIRDNGTWKLIDE